MIVILAFHLVQFTGPDGQVIDVYPENVVTVRPLRPGKEEHFGPGIKCLIHTTDGRHVAVIEDCDTVKRKLEQQ